MAELSVVTTAMRTIIENNAGEMTPSSSPMLSTMSSMSPRAFMRAPSAAAGRAATPVARAAAYTPPSFPNVATRMIRPQISHWSSPPTRSIRVRMPT